MLNYNIKMFVKKYKLIKLKKCLRLLYMNQVMKLMKTINLKLIWKFKKLKKKMQNKPVKINQNSNNKKIII